MLGIDIELDFDYAITHFLKVDIFSSTDHLFKILKNHHFLYDFFQRLKYSKGLIRMRT